MKIFAVLISTLAMTFFVSATCSAEQTTQEKNTTAQEKNTTAQQITGSASTVQTGIEVGNKAPDFSLDSLEGKTFSLKDIYGKKVLLLFFWATW